MKRLRIWLKSFSLVQQFLAVALFTIFISVFFFSTFLRDSIDNFTNNQMKSYLHRYETHYLASEKNNIQYTDINIDSIVYSTTRGVYLGQLAPEYITIIDNLDPTVKENTDGVIVTENGLNYVYSIAPYDDTYALVSFVNQTYYQEVRSSLVQGVINLTLFFVLGLFAFFIVWVASLIRPLNDIRNYIDKLKSGEKAQLSIIRNDEIGEVGEALISMNDELSKQSRIREEMVQNISHDLKTPIATIKSYSESIKDGVYPYGTLEKSVDVIIDHANRLERKAYNLNTFNKLGYLTDSDNETLMSPVITKVIVASKAIREDIKVEVNVDETVIFHGEEEPWRIVVENLLDNAIRYARTKVQINLKDRLLEVYNDGDLMSKERLDKLFKPYEKGTKGNFGLGLSIVKRVCETYGYTVIGDNMDDGVIFRVYTNKQTRKKKPAKKNKDII